MSGVLLNFKQHCDAWTVHFLRDYNRTTIGSRTRFQYYGNA
jgi:hypothetical protein